MAKAIWLIFPQMGIGPHLQLAGQSKWGETNWQEELEGQPNFVNDTFDPWHDWARHRCPNKRPISSQFWCQRHTLLANSGGAMAGADWGQPHQVMELGSPLLRHISNTYMGLLVWMMMIHVELPLSQGNHKS